MSLTPEQFQELDRMRSEDSSATVARWIADARAKTQNCKHQSYTISRSAPPHCDDCGSTMVAAIWQTGHGHLVVGEPT